MFTESQGWGGVGLGEIQRLNNRHFQLCPTIYPTLQPLRPHLSLSKEVDRGESRHLTPSSALLLHQSVTTAACYGFTPSPSPPPFLLSTSSSLTPPILLPASSLST